LVATDNTGAWTRVDQSALLVAEELRLSTSPQSLADARVRKRIADRLAAIAVDYIVDSPRDRLGAALNLTDDLPHSPAPQAITFSGGVSEYLFGHEQQDYGDIAPFLATALSRELARRSSLPVIDPGQHIRATVIGASQFTVQVSGKTIYLPDPGVLPVHNVPVVHLEIDRAGPIDPGAVADAIRQGLTQMDLAPSSRMAIAFAWHGDPEYSQLAAAGRAIVQALAPAERTELLFLVIDGDIGKTLGRLLHRELNLRGPIVSIDGVQLQELDYVDVGQLLSPPGVVPVVVKSLLFS
jgi:ethanolamine utilization protein EutA